MEEIEAVFSMDDLGELGRGIGTDIVDVTPLSDDEYEELDYDKETFPNLARITYTCEGLEYDPLYVRPDRKYNRTSRRLFIYADEIPHEVVERALENQYSNKLTNGPVKVFGTEEHGWVIEVEGEPIIHGEVA